MSYHRFHRLHRWPLSGQIREICGSEELLGDCQGTGGAGLEASGSVRGWVAGDVGVV